MGSPTCPTCGSKDPRVRYCGSAEHATVHPVDSTQRESRCTYCDNRKWHATPTPPAPADDAIGEDDVRRCEGCNGVAVTTDPEDVPLCRPCATACDEATAFDRGAAGDAMRFAAPHEMANRTPVDSHTQDQALAKVMVERGHLEDRNNNCGGCDECRRLAAARAAELRVERALAPLSLEQRRDLWRAFPVGLQAQVRRLHPAAAAELDADPSPLPEATEHRNRAPGAASGHGTPP